jgi:hypothetical protein
MTEIIFSIDYELYGDGHGSLQDLVLEPAAQLAEVFQRNGVRFVAFVEAMELARIRETLTDPHIRPVCEQIRDLHRMGHEIGLHIHPQWANARHHDGVWHLDYDEYNLCRLPRSRIEQIVDECLNFLRDAVHDMSFRPIAFRAGNWLLQPTALVAEVLADRGLKIDSSVFRGGYHRHPAIDYRPAIRNRENFWKFRSDVNRPDPNGSLIEVPIYTAMVPIWRMLTRKRVALQQRSQARRKDIDGGARKWLDYARPLYPLKFDFCRMSFKEMTEMMEFELGRVNLRDGRHRPIVAIGHTKDLKDTGTVNEFLRWLGERKIRVTTFRSAYDRYLRTACGRPVSVVREAV